jgi:hypothetical protein
MGRGGQVNSSSYTQTLCHMGNGPRKRSISTIDIGMDLSLGLSAMVAENKQCGDTSQAGFCPLCNGVRGELSDVPGPESFFMILNGSESNSAWIILESLSSRHLEHMDLHL